MVNTLNVGGYIKGHRRRSMKPIINRMKMDSCNIIDEYNTTKLCSSCYSHTSYQKLKRGDKYVRIKGALVCTNPLCPRRIMCKATTINRDNNGGTNIATTDTSSLVSKVGLPLPPFRRSYFNESSKYVIEGFFTHEI
jgi:hypothetical protein